MNNKFSIFIGMGAAAFLIGIAYTSLDMNSPENVEKYLQTKKFHNIKVGEYNWICAKGTPVRRHFEALNENNESVQGVVCAQRSFLPDSIETKKNVKNNKL